MPEASFRLPRKFQPALHDGAIDPSRTKGLLDERERLFGVELFARKDIHEKDGEFQKIIVKQYLTLAADRKWKVVACVEKGKLLSKEAIAEKVWSSVKPHLGATNDLP